VPGVGHGSTCGQWQMENCHAARPCPPAEHVDRGREGITPERERRGRIQSILAGGPGEQVQHLMTPKAGNAPVSIVLPATSGCDAPKSSGELGIRQIRNRP